MSGATPERARVAALALSALLGCAAETSPSPPRDEPDAGPTCAEETNECGGCGTACDIGGTCRAGLCDVPRALASIRHPLGLVRDGNYLYFTSYSPTTGKVLQAAHDAADDSTMVELARAQPSPWGIAADAGDVFWTNSGTSSGSVMRLDPNGGDPIELASGLNQPEGIALDASNVYVACVGSGSLLRVPRDGGDAVELATDLGTPEAVALDDAYAYVTDSRGGRVLSVPLDGGDAVELASGLSMPSAIAVDSEWAYFTTRGDGGILKVPLDGSVTPTSLAVGSAPIGIALDDSNVYVSDEGMESETGTISRVSKDGGDVTLIAGNQDQPWSILVDDTSVYWTSSGAGTVLTTSK